MIVICVITISVQNSKWLQSFQKISSKSKIFSSMKWMLDFNFSIRLKLSPPQWSFAVMPKSDFRRFLKKKSKKINTGQTWPKITVLSHWLIWLRCLKMPIFTLHFTSSITVSCLNLQFSGDFIGFSAVDCEILNGGCSHQCIASQCKCPPCWELDLEGTTCSPAPGKVVTTCNSNEIVVTVDSCVIEDYTMEVSLNSAPLILRDILPKFWFMVEKSFIRRVITGII